ncbi:Hypothetical predicted protein [Mytilus galloprovincialis]|uniref:YqaJ viral recombinase domain-containing protein n=1 Tax=Mytilus galloprovincialis TaxID=29158 RepID=A0A8B6CAA0_MYTGA|nr:Hypothetical predicted protein [Mytilus galloprovincialis]
MRELKVKKTLFLEKMMGKTDGDWRKGCFAMIISSSRTSIYQIEQCISELLNVNDQLIDAAANTNKVSHLMKTGSTETNLSTQENYLCLNDGGDIDNPFLVKQRSDVWFEIRNKSKVTGSCIGKAIGLEGLKKQKEFLTSKSMPSQNSQEPNVDPQLQEMFDYGTKNEINAVATVVSGFLPAFHPQAQFYEEGCYIKRDSDEKTVLVVSPDGSIRANENESLFGVEIKCPFPAKSFTTPIHYSLPARYVTQILSEMHCLAVNELYFVSYSDASTAIHLAEYDRKLWDDIFAEIIRVQTIIPKKTNPEIANLRTNIEAYRQKRVHLIAEISSIKAMPCNHPEALNSRRNRHACDTTSPVITKVVDICHKVAYSSIGIIHRCHTLSAQRASEVLVFMLCDLDRMSKPELPHAFPIGYGLKGYSMKTEAMRQMLHDVFLYLFQMGLYTPAFFYDGQWAKLSNQDANGKSLTLLD